MTMTHTTGSKSFARVADELFKENGTIAGRHEVFIRVHTRKDGSTQAEADAIIKEKIHDACASKPELATKTIQQGDLFSNLFGKEKRARVRAVGPGPTPQSLKMDGVHKCSSTKLQLAALAQMRTEHDNAVLREGVDCQEVQLSQVLKEMAELKKSLHLAQSKENGEAKNNNNHASNSPIQDMRCQSHESGARSFANEINTPVNEDMRSRSNDSAARSVANEICTPINEDERNVILFSVIGRCIPVAKVTVKRTSRTAVVGGTALRREYCEVLVNYVLKKGTPLPRPYDNITTMADAKGCLIAWPYERLEDDSGLAGGDSTHAERS